MTGRKWFGRGPARGDRADRWAAEAFQAIRDDEVDRARVAADKAVKLYRELAADDPGTYLPKLARSLQGLGVALSALDEDAGATAALTEATTLFRQLTDDDEEKHRADLARSTHDLAVLFTFLRRYDEALPYSRQAAELAHELALDDPDAHLPTFADASATLGLVLSKLGDAQPAADAGLEAVRLYRKLDRFPASPYRAGRAKALLIMGIVLLRADLPDKALAFVAEAFDLFTELYGSLVDVPENRFTVELFLSLVGDGLAPAVHGGGQNADRVQQVIAETVRGLAETDPAAYDAHLKSALRSLGAVRE